MVPREAQGGSRSDQTLIRVGRMDDAPKLAELMIGELRTRFGRLGPGVVRLLHRHMISSRHCLCLVAEREGAAAGYAAVLLHGRSFYREFMLKRGLLCGLLALPRLIKPSNLRTMFTGLAYFSGSPANDPDAELVSIVVDRHRQGMGIGRALWNGIVAELRGRGIRDLKIATDVENSRANRMYRESGCSMVRTERLYHDTQVHVYYYRVAE